MQTVFLILILLFMSSALTATGLLIGLLRLDVLGQVIAHQNQVVVGLALCDASLGSLRLLVGIAAALIWVRIHVRHGLRLRDLVLFPSLNFHLV